MKRGVRGLAFIVASAAHIALVALLMRPTLRHTTERVYAPSMVVVFLEPEARRVTEDPLRPSAPSPGLRVPTVTLEPPRVELSGPITVEPEPSPETPAHPPSIDWQQETRTAAARTAEALEAKRGRKGKFAPDPRFARPAPRPQFGWDQSKTHRIEALPEGGTVIHLNDRCLLAVSGGFILPVCKLGKIAARGDLFEHMGDTPPGDDDP